MIDKKFIPAMTDEELANASAGINSIVMLHHEKLNDPRLVKKKLSPPPSINPATLELQNSINNEIEIRKKTNG